MRLPLQLFNTDCIGKEDKGANKRSPALHLYLDGSQIEQIEVSKYLGSMAQQNNVE